MIILYLSERGEAEGRFPLFFQYLGGQGGVIGQGKKRGCWSFFLLVFTFLAPFSFSGYSLAFELEAHNMRFTLRVFFSHLPPRPSPLLCFSIITLLNPQRWHFDDERSRLQRDRHRRSCPPRRKVTLWTPRGDYSRRPWCDRSFLPLLEEEEEDEEKKTECVVFFPPRRRQK